MVTSVKPIRSLTDAFLLPPLGRTVKGIWARENIQIAETNKTRVSFFIQKVLVVPN
jgi:hypothetical protein